MRSPEDAFYSSLDADSEHEEGKFYVWTVDAARAPLDADEFAVAAQHWGLDGPQNFEGVAWNLCVTRPLAAVAGDLGIDVSVAQARLASARAKLLAARALRGRPERDDKLLTSWNALMIGGLARRLGVRRALVGPPRNARSISCAPRCGATIAFSPRTRMAAPI